MGPYIPESVRNRVMIARMEEAGLKLVHQGKVRDTYALPGYPDKLLVVATDRISIFDFVLGALVAAKGHVLTAMTVFWLTKVIKAVRHHLVAFGAGIDAYLPEALRNDIDLQCRSLVVEKLTMLPIECIVRGYLTGSVLKEYETTGQVSGYALPTDLSDGSRLPAPIFTPSTKATVGHDVNIPAASVRDRYGYWPADLSILVFHQADHYARERGILVADTKLELSVDGVLADEVLTPDSSRFWLETDWQKAQEKKKAPSGFDKQYAREWGKRVVTIFEDEHGNTINGINNLRPENPRHQTFVGELEMDAEVRERTTQLYLQGFDMLTGSKIHGFQMKDMGVVHRPNA